MKKRQLAALTAAALLGSTWMTACGERSEDSSQKDSGVVEDIVTDVEDGVKDIVTDAGDVIDDLTGDDDSHRESDTSTSRDDSHQDSTDTTR